MPVRLVRAVRCGVLAAVWPVLALAPVAARSQSLLELYRASAGADPALAGSQAQLRAAQERESQARSGFGPAINATFGSSHSRYTEPTNFFTPEARDFNTRTATLQLSQPLYKPTLFAQLQQTEALSEQARLQTEQARAEGLQRFVEAAFELLKARDVLRHLRTEQVATAAQLAQARRSFTVGTVAVTDVRDAQAKADVVAAQLAGAEHELSLRHQLLQDLVGQPTPELLSRGLEGPTLPALEPASLPQWLADAQAGNPALRQALWALEAARQEVLKAGLGHAPTVEATYTLTKTGETGSVTSTQLRRSNQNQLGLTLNLPLYSTGLTQSKLREALAQRDKAEADVEAARRTLASNLRQSFSAVLSAVSQARGLETAVASQEIAVRANQRGYEVGMKVNSEVLAAQSRLFEARRDLSKARYDAWLAFIKLKGAAGQLGEPDLAAIDAVLVAAQPLVPAAVDFSRPAPLPTLQLRLDEMPPDPDTQAPHRRRP